VGKYCRLSRAVRVGNVIEVSGTVASDGSNVVGKNDVYLQTKFILEKIETALKEAEASLNDVVRTRIYVKDISKWSEVAKAHCEVFGNIKQLLQWLRLARSFHLNIWLKLKQRQFRFLVYKREIRLEFKTHPKTKIGIFINCFRLRAFIGILSRYSGFRNNSFYGEQAVFFLPEVIITILD